MIFLFSPVNKEELFNLRHAQARNVIERIFGVLKKHWDILNRPAQYSMAVQAQIPPGLAAVHNFIGDHDDTDIEHYLELLEVNCDLDPASFGEPGHGAIGREERERASAL
jgi:hypothetical protein